MKSLPMISLLGAALALGACGHHDHAAEGHDHEAETATHADPHAGHSHEGLIELCPTQAARFGVKVEKVAPGPFAAAVRASGRIERSGADAATASAPLAGTLTLAPGISVGARVAAGQTIGHVDAAAVSGGDANLAAKAAYENAERELRRLEALAADRLVTVGELNAARAAYESAKAAYSPTASSGAVSAPRAGTVTALPAQSGAYVGPGQPVATISSSNRLTLHAEVTPDQAHLLSGITDARIGSFTLSQHGGRREGTSAENGYACIFFSFDNSDGSQLPGAGVEAFLLGAERQGVIAVPREAIVEQQGQYYVFTRHGKEFYEKRPVKLGATDGLRVEILQGLKGGEPLVVSGAMTVRLAESSAAIPSGHNHAH